MSVLTDNFKTFIQSDGEAIVASDLNDAQRFLSARVFDQIMGSLAPMVDNVRNDPEFTGQLELDGWNVSPYAHCLNSGAAYLRQGTANNKVQIAAGTLLQKIGNQTGDEPKVLAFNFDGSQEIAIANGDVANPRVDIVQMKLEYIEGDSQMRDFEDAVTDAPSTGATNKKRRVQCTLSVKQGVAAASPVYPAPDAGYVVICGVVVGTNYVGAAGFKFEDTAGAVAVIHDQRMPLRVRAYGVGPREYIFAAGHTEVNRSYIQSTGGNDLWMPLHRCGQAGRLVMVAASFFDAAPLVSKISRIAYTDGGGFVSSAITHLANANMNGGTTVFERRAGGILTFQNQALFAVGPVVQANANGMGAPIWTNAKRSPTETFRLDAPPQWDTLVLTYVASANTSQFGACTFYVAEGL